MTSRAIQSSESNFVDLLSCSTVYYAVKLVVQTFIQVCVQNPGYSVAIQMKAAKQYFHEVMGRWFKLLTVNETQVLTIQMKDY